MGKLQPYFVWQKYQGKPEDAQEQFQYQLQQEHILTANAVNTTVDDLSYWQQERPTSFTSITSKQIYTQTYQALVSFFPIPHNIDTKILNIVGITGVIQDTLPLTSRAYPVPYTDPTTLANGIGVYVTKTQIVLVTSGGTYNSYTATITLQYTKK